MENTLTQPADPAKEIADSGEWIGHGAKRRRRVKTPEVLLVPHGAIRHPELNRTDAITLAALAYRRGYGQELSPRLLSEWCGWSIKTSRRSLSKLARLDLVDEAGGLRGEFPEVAGSVRLVLKELRLHGPIDALGLAQLRSWIGLGMAKINGAWFEVAAPLLAKFLGACERTARRVLQRLASGETVKIRSVVRKGQQILFCSLVELKRALGKAAFVRVRGERERERTKEKRKALAKAAEAEAREHRDDSLEAAQAQAEVERILQTLRGGAGRLEAGP